MIYRLINDYLDLGKLEHISDIKEKIFVPGGAIEYWFKYQINGYVYDCDTTKNQTYIINLRHGLINAWQEYKEQR